MIIISAKGIQSKKISDQEIIYFGNDPQNRPLEILAAETKKKPNSQTLQKKWKDRQNNRRVPLLVILLYKNKAYVCGPNGEKPPIYSDLNINQIERICNEALEEPNRFSATLVLTSFLPTLEDHLPGIRNEGFLSTNELKYGARDTNEWSKACDKAKAALNNGNKKLIESLGFDIDKRDNFTKFLRFKNQKRALGILLDRGVSLDLSNPDFANQTPVSHGISIASQENLPYVIIKSGGLLRIYPVDSTKGIGSRGRTETFLEINTSVLSDEYAGLLWLIFSGSALKSNGTLTELIESSSRYGIELANDFRSNVYNEVIPLLSKGIAKSKNFSDPSKEDLDSVYQMSLIILFRLIFISYAEDRNLLPYKTNEEYKRNSLQAISSGILNSSHSKNNDLSDSYWQQINQLFKAVDKGNKSWSIPAYNGGLFSANTSSSLSFAMDISNISLPNNIMIPVLEKLLLCKSRDGIQPVDFRSLSVREFGSIYESLLDSELGFAKQDLVIDKKNQLYRPCKSNEKPEILKGDIYTQNTSGARKESASFYTRPFAVQHLLDTSLLPALSDHIKRLESMNDHDAAKYFFDFKVADISMGSGHFLIAAIDAIENTLETYRHKRPLAAVSRELQVLRDSSKKILGEFGEYYEIDDSQLIRRLIAKRCIYGVDMNSMAVELARLSIWIHTFVPGLPLSFLDRNLIEGDSLTGIGILDEINELIQSIDEKSPQSSLFEIDANSILGDARKDLLKLAQISESSIEDIEREKIAWKKAQDSIQPAKALCDIICGSRINGIDFPKIIIDQWDYYKKDLFQSNFHKDAIKGMENYKMLHFPVAFPEVFLRERSGFDVIIGNPPWEKAIPKEDSFWLRFYPGFDGLPQREKEALKKKLYLERPDLVSILENERKYNKILRQSLKAGNFPGMGKGDPDLYKAFSWRFWFLTSSDSGRIGVVLPRSVLNALGSEDFRFVIFKESKSIEITTLINKNKWIFDVDPRYSIALLSITKSSVSSKSRLKIQGPYSSLKDYQECLNKSVVSLLGDEILKWTKSASLPLLHSQECYETFSTLRHHPNLDHEQINEWRTLPMTELHATQDKKLMDMSIAKTNKEYFPVLKGESFNLWNVDTSINYAYAKKSVVIPRLQQKRIRSNKTKNSVFSEFKDTFINDEKTLSCFYPRIAFRGITNRTNTRTTICALLPPNVFVQHSAPVFIWPRGCAKDCAYLLGVLSSIPLDWYARRIVEINLTFHIIEEFPIPRPPINNPIRNKLIKVAGRLASIDTRYKKWSKEVGVDCGPLEQDEKHEMICKLDALVALLYDLTKDQLIYIFESFHEGWDYEKRLEDTLKYYLNYKK